MVSFSPGWNFAPPTGLKYFCEYMLNFSPGAKRKFPWESLLRCENTVNAHVRVPFSARAEIPFRLHETFLDFQARLAGLKNLAWFENTWLGFSARAELRPGLNCAPGWIPLHVIENWFSEDLFQKPGGNFRSGWNSPCNQALRGHKVLTSRPSQTARRKVFIYIPKIYEPLSDSESEQELAEHDENAIFSLSEEEDELESFWELFWELFLHLRWNYIALMLCR